MLNLNGFFSFSWKFQDGTEQPKYALSPRCYWILITALCRAFNR